MLRLGAYRAYSNAHANGNAHAKSLFNIKKRGRGASALRRRRPGWAPKTGSHTARPTFSVAQHVNDRKNEPTPNQALNRLPPLCRRAFILVRYEGMSFEQAAVQMGLHPRRVRRFVQRAFVAVGNP